MENQRLILFLLLSFTVLLLWQAWQQDYGVHQPVATSGTSTSAPPQVAAVPANAPTVAAKDVPVSAPLVGAAPSAANVVPNNTVAQAVGRRVKIETDLMRFELDTLGANIQRGWLLKYPVSLDKKDEPYPLMGDTAPIFHVAQSGLLANMPAPDHHAEYQIDQLEYKLQPGQDS
ncbi:MAG: membrane protein insertase YidC, partial [Gammaproteobacteria bacterium]|nr:membrane protein insertase YidC [Gammaproteobacteria bacterium]